MFTAIPLGVGAQQRADRARRRQCMPQCGGAAAPSRAPPVDAVAADEQTGDHCHRLRGRVGAPATRPSWRRSATSWGQLQPRARGRGSSRPTRATGLGSSEATPSPGRRLLAETLATDISIVPAGRSPALLSGHLSPSVDQGKVSATHAGQVTWRDHRPHQRESCFSQGKLARCRNRDGLERYST